MKKILTAVTLLIAIALGLPWATGYSIQKKYTHLISQASERTPLSLHIVHYQRGWFSSIATVQVSSSTPNNNTADATPTENTQFIIKEKLYHGPVILRSRNPSESFGKGITWALALSQIHVNQPDLKLNTLTTYHFNGSINIQFNCPTITHSLEPESMTLAFLGLQGTFTFSNKFRHSQGKIKLANADVPLREGHQKINEAVYAYSLNKNSYGLWQGKRSLTIGNVLLNTQDSLQLQGLALSLTDDTSSNKLNSELDAQIEHFQLNGTDFGKQKIVVNLSNLNLATLSEIGQKADLLDQQSASLSTRALELTPLALQLLNDGLNLNIPTVDLNTQWGKIHGNASLNITRQESAPTQFQALLSNTIGQADFIFPIKLLEEVLTLRYQAMTTAQQEKNPTTPETLAKDDIHRWVLAGWLTPNDNHYQINVAYKNNQLRLNGRLIKLPNLPIPDMSLTFSKHP